MASDAPGTTSEIVTWDALELSRAIREREVSCVEVMDAFLGQIERHNPAHNAIVSLRDRDELLEEAAERDRALDRGEYRGWMHGFPQAPKDLTSTAGIRTTMGSRLFEDNVPTADSILVERIRQTGAVLIGKTNTPEFGLGSHTYNDVFGATRNAYAPDRTAGGSSGGAAVALAQSSRCQQSCLSPPPRPRGHSVQSGARALVEQPSASSSGRYTAQAALAVA